MKVLNYIASAIMIFTSIWRLAQMNILTFFVDCFYTGFSVYLTLFGILLAAAEYQFVNILKYIEFLITYSGKGMFLIFVGVLLFDNQKQVDLIASLSLSMIGLFNIIVSCVSDNT